MNRSITLAVLLISSVTIFSSASRSQTKPSASGTGLLFEISGKDLAKPSFIFGTFHTLCPADMFPMDKLTPYVDKADRLVMEIDMDDPSEIASLAGAVKLADGGSWKESLTAAQFAKVDEMFMNIIGYSVNKLVNLKPVLVSTIIISSPKVLGCSVPSSYDLSLVMAAVSNKKPIFGLETAASQGQVLESQSLQKQAKDLYELSLDPKKSENEFKELIAAYKSQDLEKLRTVAMNKKDKEDLQFEKKLIDDRNAAWIPKIENFIKDKPAFIAVGAGHLGGESGVLRLLKDRGYTIKAIQL